ncbi:hypothetical protein [Streptomyces sp. NPDC007984]|uniref:hypothetical protein n=1 Tax=Streptomyces sp. NPDC007984 TaxID=3364801 RepID=UPI0036E056CD
MTSATTAPPPMAPDLPTPRAHAARGVDNRAAYVSFGLAYVLGHGAAASGGGTLLIALPGWLPMTLLVSPD